MDVHLVGVVGHIDEENGQILHRLSEKFGALHFLLRGGVAVAESCVHRVARGLSC